MLVSCSRVPQPEQQMEHTTDTQYGLLRKVQIFFHFRPATFSGWLKF